MSDAPMKHHVEDGHTLVTERELRAPRQLVFEAFSSCEHLANWWPPPGFALSHCRLEFRTGGTWHYCLMGTDSAPPERQGSETWGLARYGELRAPELITYTDHFSDSQATIKEDLPAMNQVISLVSVGNRTLIINRTTFHSAAALKDMLGAGMIHGITDTWNRLAGHLQDMQRD